MTRSSMSAKATVPRLHPTVAALLILAAILAVFAGLAAGVWELTHRPSESTRLHAEQVRLLNTFHHRHIGADVVTGVPSYSLRSVPDAAFQIEVYDPDTIIAQPPTGADGGPVILSSNGPVTLARLRSDDGATDALRTVVRHWLTRGAVRISATTYRWRIPDAQYEIDRQGLITSGHANLLSQLAAQRTTYRVIVTRGPYLAFSDDDVSVSQLPAWRRAVDRELALANATI
jgi:hypothetical protein